MTPSGPDRKGQDLPPSGRPRIAVVGAGISGLGAAERLGVAADVTVFESSDRLGGHANTLDVTLQGITHGVDTGFLVFNRRTYPRLTALFESLEVECAPSEMSFSVQAPRHGGKALEWCGSSLDGVFADRLNLVRPRFHGMLMDLLRFNRMATALALRGPQADLAQPLDEFLRQYRFGTAFRDDYLLPMIGCIWSCPTSQMLQMPVDTLVRFCHNHGLLQVSRRPQWYTVRGGSRQYVERLRRRLGRVRLATAVLGVRRMDAPQGGVAVLTASGPETFDEVILACHAPQALALLSDARPQERLALAPLRTCENEAVLHTDEWMLPRRRAAWAAWNYERAAPDCAPSGSVCLHYLLNRLQPLPWQEPLIVSLNPVRAPRARCVIARLAYAHPVLDQTALEARARLQEIQGRDRVWFCGAWTGHGFHEDGLRSGQEVARQILERQGAAQPPHARARAPQLPEAA